MEAVTHLEKVITGEVSAVTHLEKVIAQETSAVTYTEKVIAGEATPITHLQKVIAGVASPVTHLEQVWAGGSPTPSEHEYTGAVPVTITADGTPLLDYTIYGNTVQSGTPTPTTPIQPQECGERTGNLLPSPVAAIKSNNGITVRSDGAGRYYVSGTAENDAYITFNIQPFLIPKSAATGGNGTFSMFNTKTYLNDAVKLEFYYQGTFIDNWGLIDLNRTSINYTAMANKTTDTVGFFVKSGSTVDFQISPELTNDGVLPASFEPYGYKIPISSGGTTTPVYLGEVETTRKIKKLVLTGEEETWDTISGNAPYRIQLPDIVQTSDKNIVLFTSSHYRAVSNNAFWNWYTACVSWTFSGGVNAKCLVFRDRNQATLADFKSYLAQQYAAGTPVTVWYVLAEPETGIVNEPLMKIGDYADTLSMEQVGVSIPTLNGQTVIDVETTLKPSEMYIKYNG